MIPGKDVAISRSRIQSKDSNAQSRDCATCISPELASEIGTIARFRSESSLALYLGIATLDNSSGKYRSSKRQPTPYERRNVPGRRLTPLLEIGLPLMNGRIFQIAAMPVSLRSISPAA